MSDETKARIAEIAETARLRKLAVRFYYKRTTGAQDDWANGVTSSIDGGVDDDVVSLAELLVNETAPIRTLLAAETKRADGAERERDHARDHVEVVVRNRSDMNAYCRKMDEVIVSLRAERDALAKELAEAHSDYHRMQDEESAARAALIKERDALAKELATARRTITFLVGDYPCEACGCLDCVAVDGTLRCKACNHDSLACKDCDAAIARAERAEKELADANAWASDDLPLPEDDKIRAAFPTRTGDHETYAEAMRIVGASRSKGKLVGVVNWLLARLAAYAKAVEAARKVDTIDGSMCMGCGSSVRGCDGGVDARDGGCFEWCKLGELRRALATSAPADGEKV